ncbi:MAG: 2-keto-4-pentenoate hydratase, partial [Chloroflexi bacterium]|nr:2-keto-4-pentenoate hydratase [Chloroflexota bacterium]
MDQPDFGHILDTMMVVDGSAVPRDTLVYPRVEGEIAFVLGEDLRGPGVTVPQVLAATRYVMPSLEIVDSRIADWKITLLDTIADNASSGALVLGSTPTALSDVDLRLGGAVMTRNGAVAGTGAGGAVLGSPINSLVWLANTLGARGV